MFVDLSFSNTDENWSAYTEHIKCSTIYQKCKKVILVQKKIYFLLNTDWYGNSMISLTSSLISISVKERRGKYLIHDF